MNSQHSLLTAVIMGALIAAPVGVNADDASRREFAAQFTCGLNPGTTARLAAGDFRTSIAVRNDSRHLANVSAQVALTFPPGGPNPGSVIKLERVKLDPYQAVSFDCDALQDALGLPAPYVQGFLTVKSRRRLDVSATQTAVDLTTGQVTSINVRQVNATTRRRDD